MARAKTVEQAQVEEVDWSVGQVLDTIRQEELGGELTSSYSLRTMDPLAGYQLVRYVAERARPMKVASVFLLSGGPAQFQREVRPMLLPQPWTFTPRSPNLPLPRCL